MTWLEASILGLVQGLTEFLPVSSSGHLVLCRRTLGVQVELGVALEVMLHLGTALAILTVFRAPAWRLAWAPMHAAKGDREPLKELGLLVLATVPTVLVAFPAKHGLEWLKDGPYEVPLTCCCLLVTGALLAITDRAESRDGSVGVRVALLIGIAQAFAILPGVSRSGATICVALLLGVSRERAGEFSLLMGVIAICGAAVLEGRELLHTPPPVGLLWALLAGTVVAYVSGLLAIRWLLAALAGGRLRPFGWYCGVVGIGGLIWAAVTAG